MNKLIQIKKDKFVKELKKKYQHDGLYTSKTDKIIITKSKSYNEEKRCILIEGFDEKGEKILSYTYISKEEKLAMVYHIISMLSENMHDLYTYWESILEFPDELIESEYQDYQ